MLDVIEKVLYINLDEREDRRASIENELSIFSKDRVVRISAIKHRNGLIGCAMSHILALEMAIENNWKNVLIVEDDMKWHRFDEGIKIFDKLVANPYDVICLGGACVQYEPETYRAKYVSTTTSYLVNNHYFATLLANLKEGVIKLTEDEEKHSSYALDRNWLSLLHTHKWFVIQPTMCVQAPGYSNIVNNFVNYYPQFGVY